MKRILPIVLIVLVGLGLAGGAFFLLKNTTKAPEKSSGGAAGVKEESVLRELALEDRPFTTLVPRVDGREFHLTISKIPSGVDLMEYELVYKVASGITQGVPGSIKVVGQSKIERDLLLGTCSSGKCRYDEGVEDGTFTLRFRDKQGRLVAKLETPFHLQKGGKELTLDGTEFKISGVSLSSSTYYLVMSTFGLPGKLSSGTAASGPYGVFTKGSEKVGGTVTLDSSGVVYRWTGSQWDKLAANKTTSLGTFVLVASE